MVRYQENRLRKLFPFTGAFKGAFIKPRAVRLIASIVFFLVSFIWMIFCVNVAAFRFPQDDRVLPDLLFDIFPYVKQAAQVADVLLYTLLLLLVVRVVFHSIGVAIARRFFTICGVIYLLRGVLLVATSYPDPRASCQGYTPTWSLPQSLYSSCGDMTFSGNTVVFTLVALCWINYSSYLAVRVFISLLSVGGMLSLILARSHYTVDILTALVISALVWSYYHLMLHLPPRSQFRVISWLESPDYEEDLPRNLQDSPLRELPPRTMEKTMEPSGADPLDTIQNILQLKDYQELESQIHFT